MDSNAPDYYACCRLFAFFPGEEGVMVDTDLVRDAVVDFIVDELASSHPAHSQGEGLNALRGLAERITTARWRSPEEAEAYAEEDEAASMTPKARS